MVLLLHPLFTVPAQPAPHVIGLQEVGWSHVIFTERADLYFLKGTVNSFALAYNGVATFEGLGTNMR